MTSFPKDEFVPDPLRSNEFIAYDDAIVSVSSQQIWGQGFQDSVLGSPGESVLKEKSHLFIFQPYLLHNHKMEISREHCPVTSSLSPWFRKYVLMAHIF